MSEKEKDQESNEITKEEVQEVQEVQEVKEEREPTLSELLAAQRKIQQNIKSKMERKQTVKNEPVPKPNPNPSVNK